MHLYNVISDLLRTINHPLHPELRTLILQKAIETDMKFREDQFFYNKISIYLCWLLQQLN